MTAPLVTRNSRSSQIGLSLLTLAVLALAAAPGWGGAAVMSVMIEILVYIGLASLWNLLAGYAGIVSVGQQAYVGIGAYTLFALCNLGHLPPLLGLLAAGLFAALLSLPVGFLLFRLRGAYFAIGSWVVAEVFRLIMANWDAMGAGSGTSLPASVMLAIAPTRLERLEIIYEAALILSVFTIALVVLVLRSRFGLALTAIRDNELAARSNGVSVARAKFVIYIVTAFGTGLLGALIFFARLRISPDAAFSVDDWSALIIFMTVIGGIGSVEGPIIGAIVYFLLRGFLANLGSIYLIILGAVAISVMILFPAGLWGVVAERTGWSLLPLKRKVIVET